VPIPSQWASGVERKSYEDTLDAVVCAWVCYVCPGGTRRSVW